MPGPIIDESSMGTLCGLCNVPYYIPSLKSREYYSSLGICVHPSAYWHEHELTNQERDILAKWNRKEQRSWELELKRRNKYKYAAKGKI